VDILRLIIQHLFSQVSKQVIERRMLFAFQERVNFATAELLERLPEDLQPNRPTFGLIVKAEDIFRWK